MRSRMAKAGVILCTLFFSLTNITPTLSATATAAPGSTVQTNSSAAISGKFISTSVHTATGQAANGTRKTGHITPSVKISASSPSGSRRYKSSSIPSSYDLRSKNKLTSVRNQGSVNDCWAYAAIGSLESFLMPGENNDFSETDLAENSGFDTGLDGGGNDVMATAYLARWGGPLNEGTTSGVKKHAQNVDWLPGRSGNATSSVDEAIKEAVMEYGAVSSPIYMNETEYYNTNTNSYYDPHQTDTADHAVDIVGWDDSYAASNFTTTAGGTPADNGAYLCRNSWGADWGDGGYFYVSYDDMTIGQDESAVLDNAEANFNYSYNYQYDPLGVTNALSMYSSQQWMANVFTAQNSDKLSAVSFYTLQTSTQYKVYVISNYTGSLANGILAASGTIEDAGYHTVGLSSDVSLAGGKPFAVEVEFIGSSDEIPIEEPISNYSSQATASAGQSYISGNGSGWYDTTTLFDENGSITVNENGNSDINVCLKAFTVSTLPALTDIDTPSNGSVISAGTLSVSGWALNHSGIARVDAYAYDSSGAAHFLGSVPGSALTARTDVEGAFSAYGTLNSGYSLSASTKTLKTGAYTLAVAGIGNDGSAQWATKTITIGPPPSPLTTVDAPSNGTMWAGTATVSGWALNHSGVARVDLYAFDSSSAAHFLGSVSAGAFTARPDVQRAFPAFDTLNSGYRLSVNTKTLKAGAYTLAVAGIGNDGSVQWATKTIAVGPSPLTTIDVPSNSAVWTGTATVSGWALNHSGIARVDLYAFGSNGAAHFLGSVSAGALTARPDVQGAFPAYGILNSGYRLSVSTKTLKAGAYTLAVAGIGNDGSVQWATKAITVGLSPLTTIDAPADGTTWNGTATVSGWALNHSGIARVDLYAFDSNSVAHFLGSVSAGALTARPDVQKAFPTYGTLNSGYRLSVNAKTLKAGAYTLAVAAIGDDGDVQWATKAVTVR